MFDFGWAELLIIMAIAVFVIGPKEIPDIMMTLGRMVRRLQYIKYAFSQQFEDFMQEHNLNEIRHYAAMESDGDSDGASERIADEDYMVPLPQKTEVSLDQNQDEGAESLSGKAKRLGVAELYAHIEKNYVEAFQQPSDNIDDFLAHYKNRSVHILDAGCGPGVDIAYLYDKGHQVTGLDLSMNMVDQARKKCSAAIIKQGDMREMPFGDAEFEGLISSYSIIHLKKDEVPQVFAEFNRVLISGGYLFIGFQAGAPVEKWMNEPFDPSVEFFLNVSNIHEIRSLLEEAGFDILEIFERPFTSEEELPFEKVSMVARKIT
jgi:ubiquinone/menaquinone biosynthesis C-methylase UbiE/Sec-independent protein translocase protein TatA